MQAVEVIRGLPSTVARTLLAAKGEPWSFASDEHQEFFDSHHLELVASGWMGAGKSRVLCQKAWMVARQYPGVTVALFRKTAASIPATTGRTFERDVVDHAYIAKRNRSENWWELTNGSRIYFLGLDPDPTTGVPSKVGSLDLGWAGVDEAVELSEDDWIMLLGRLRDPRMPWHQLAAATNPGPPKHWLRMRMLASGTNRLMLTIRGNKFLTPEYMAMLADLPDTAAGRRLGKGEWAAAEGVIWSFPDSQVRPAMEIKRSPGVGSPYKQVIAGVDWGFVHAFACEVITQTGSGRLAVAAELYERGKTVNDIIPMLKALRDKWEITMFYADPSEPAYIADCANAGLPIMAANNDVDPGLQAVATEIKAGMTVSPDCQGLLGEIPGYTWQPNRGGGFKEEPIKVNDDACDALRYGVMALRGDDWGTGSWGGNLAAATA